MRHDVPRHRRGAEESQRPGSLRTLRERVQRLRRAARPDCQVLRAGAAATQRRRREPGRTAARARAGAAPPRRPNAATHAPSSQTPPTRSRQRRRLRRRRRRAKRSSPHAAATSRRPTRRRRSRTRDRSARPKSSACCSHERRPRRCRGPRTSGPTTARRAQHGARSRWWAAAAAFALLALGAQAVHHFRSELAGHATFGPWIDGDVWRCSARELAPSWDVQQYEIIDWVATAEPNARGLGSLKITARIQNRGPLRQPYPAVQLRLKDRWEEAVGSRMFTPAEYLPRDTPRGRLMSPGETARAEIEVVDPGPDAYGFELDVCIEVEASLVTCGTDEVFL